MNLNPNYARAGWRLSCAAHTEQLQKPQTMALLEGKSKQASKKLICLDHPGEDGTKQELVDLHADHQDEPATFAACI